MLPSDNTPKKSLSTLTTLGLFAPVLAPAVVALMFFSLVSCGPANDTNAQLEQNRIQAQNQFPNGVPGTHGGGSSIPGLCQVTAQDWQLLRGNYSGTLYSSAGSQAYQLTLQETSNPTVQQGGYSAMCGTIGLLRLQSTGNLGNFAFDAYFTSSTSPQFLYYSDYVLTVYTFVSTIVPVPYSNPISGWIDTDFALTLKLAIRTSLSAPRSFDQSQSEIRIEDCGLSGGIYGNCTYSWWSDAGFMNDLVKR